MSAHPLTRQVLAAMERGDLGHARQLCEQAIAANRRDAGALFLLGRVLIAWNQLAEAQGILEKCVKLQPKAVESHLALAEALFKQGRNQAALARCDRAVKLAPDAPEVIYARGTMLARTDQPTRARKVLEPLVRRGGANAAVAGLYADCLHKDGATDDAIAVLREHVAAPGTADTDRRELLFRLGRLLERQKQYDDAFAAYDAANRVLPSGDDPAAYEALVDAIIETFSAERLAALPRAAHGLDHPVLVVGMPRTGSTLVEQIIGSHPAAHPAGEVHPLVDVTRRLGITIGSTLAWPTCARDMDADDADRLGREYVDALRAFGPPSARRVVDKLLNNYENLGLATVIVPDAKIIDCRRRPLDTCFSCFAEPLRPHAHPYAAGFEGLALRYRQYERLMAHWHAVLDPPLLTIAYEDLVADQEAVSRRIIDFVGLDWDDRCLAFHTLRREAMTLSREQVKQPLYTGSVHRADRFGEHVAALRARLEA